MGRSLSARHLWRSLIDELNSKEPSVPDPTQAGVPRRRCSDRKGETSESHVRSGTLIIIGGNEDKAGDRLVLSEVAARSNNLCMVIATVASSVPEENWLIYHDVFCSMGVARVEHLDIP